MTGDIRGISKHTHIHSYICRLLHTLTHIHSHTRTYTVIQTRSLTHIHLRTNVLTHSHTHTCVRTISTGWPYPKHGPAQHTGLSGPPRLFRVRQTVIFRYPRGGCFLLAFLHVNEEEFSRLRGGEMERENEGRGDERRGQEEKIR